MSSTAPPAAASTAGVSSRDIAVLGTAIAGVAVGLFVGVKAVRSSKKTDKQHKQQHQQPPHVCPFTTNQTNCSSGSMGGCSATPQQPQASYGVAAGTAALTVNPAQPTTGLPAPSPTNASLLTEAFIKPKLVAARVNPNADHPLILILCGPSGVGKGTLLQMLQRALPDSFAKSVSHTTRQPRTGEVNGTHYHFTKIEDMEAAIANNEFLEYAKVHANYYGTSVRSVRHVQESKRIPILEVDIQGAHSIHNHPAFEEEAKKPVVLFILPPTFDSLHHRLTGRGSETPSTLTTRLETAKVELKRLADCTFCDIAITNDNLDTAFVELLLSLSRVYPHLIPLLPAAQYRTSLLYRDGLDKVVPRDPSKANEWLQRAANGGHAEALAAIASASKL